MFTKIFRSAKRNMFYAEVDSGKTMQSYDGSEWSEIDAIPEDVYLGLIESASKQTERDKRVAEEMAHRAANPPTNLLELRDELLADLNRPDGRWGMHGHSCVDDDYFSALSYVVDRIDVMLTAGPRAVG